MDSFIIAKNSLTIHMITFQQLKLRSLRRVTGQGCLWIMLVFLQGCTSILAMSTSGTPSAAPGQTSGFFVPAGIFGKLATDTTPPPAPSTEATTASAVLSATLSSPFTVEVLLYASPTTKAELMQMSIFSNGRFFCANTRFHFR